MQLQDLDLQEKRKIREQKYTSSLETEVSSFFFCRLGKNKALILKTNHRIHQSEVNFFFMTSIGTFWSDCFLRIPNRRYKDISMILWIFDDLLGLLIKL